MNTEFEAHRSDFPPFPEGPFVLLAGRLQSDPDLALSAPKCLVLLRIWTLSLSQTQNGWPARANGLIWLVMLDLFRLLWCAVIRLIRSWAALEAEILVLRHQLNVLRRGSRKRLALPYLVRDERVS